MRDFSNTEALEMMKRCESIIRRQKEELEGLRLKAQAYDRMGVLIEGLGSRAGLGYGSDEASDIMHTLAKRMAELKPKPPQNAPWVEQKANLHLATVDELKAELALKSAAAPASEKTASEVGKGEATGKPEANLGYATNVELAAEISSRHRLGHTDLTYRTVDSID